MKALRLRSWQNGPALEEVPVPSPGTGEVLVRVGGAGACHSDLHLMYEFPPGTVPWTPPLTLGHENAGWVQELGAGVVELEVGQPVAVVRAWGCGRCSRCRAGFRDVLRPSDLVGGGTLPVSFFGIPYEVSVQTTYWGNRAELVEVLHLAARGLLLAEITRFELDQAERAYGLLRSGAVDGRVVVVPNGA